MRIFILSDIHIDFSENAKWVEQISEEDFQQDALILAGDVAHVYELLQETLLNLKAKFKHLFFVPGNHDLWIPDSGWTDSVEKFTSLINWCRSIGIITNPLLLGEQDKNSVWVVPLPSWYNDSSQNENSLYREKPGEDQQNRMWADNYYIHWPGADRSFAADAYFAALSEQIISQIYARPIISVSHFLPRQEMMFGDSFKPDQEKIRKFDRNPKFNFSRVAGSVRIEKQIRKLGSAIHVYGHQHINRDRILDGTRYVAHCLGYPGERKRGMVKGIEQGLKQIWDTTEVRSQEGI